LVGFHRGDAGENLRKHRRCSCVHFKRLGMQKWYNLDEIRSVLEMMQRE
jgi:hypothetical protein